MCHRPQDGCDKAPLADYGHVTSSGACMRSECTSGREESDTVDHVKVGVFPARRPQRDISSSKKKKKI